MPIFAYLSDKTNRKWMMYLGAFCLLVFPYPIFSYLLINQQTLLFGQILFAFFIAMLVGPMPALVAESFSTLTRYSGMALV